MKFFVATGKKIGFERDSMNRITRVVDDGDSEAVRETLYSYDINGDLITFTDVVGEVWTYGYDTNHNLISIIDPRGIQIMQMGYDAEGRLVGTADGYGNISLVDHDIDNLREIITDVNGNQRLYEYNDDGYVTSEFFKESGEAEVFVQSWTYDSRGNELTITDAEDNVITNTYDSNDNKTSQLLPGDTVPHTWLYSSNNNLLEETTRDGIVTRYCYDGRNNLLKTVYPNDVGVTAECDDENGVFSANIYSPYGLLLSMKDAGNNTTSFTYSYGNMTSMTDATLLVRWPQQQTDTV